MSFPSKYNGKCSKCGGAIVAGQLINYADGAARHAPSCKTGKAVAESTPAPAKQYNDKVTEDTMILGKAEYKGRDGYLVLWTGITKDGKHATKLAFRDGSKTFWGNGDVRISKMYREPISFAKLNRLTEEYKRTPVEDRGECESCGRWNGNHMDDCDMANGGMSYRNSRGQFILGADD